MIDISHEAGLFAVKFAISISFLLVFFMLLCCCSTCTNKYDKYGKKDKQNFKLIKYSNQYEKDLEEFKKIVSLKNNSSEKKSTEIKKGYISDYCKLFTSKTKIDSISYSEKQPQITQSDDIESQLSKVVDTAQTLTPNIDLTNIAEPKTDDKLENPETKSDDKLEIPETKSDKKTFIIYKFDNLNKLPKMEENIFVKLDTFVNVILQSYAKDDVQILIIINSPGGYAHEFTKIYESVRRLKTKGFQTFALIDQFSASGGYMLSCACDKIICSEFSQIGSVGVITSTYNYKNLLDKIGVEEKVFKTGKYKAGFPAGEAYSEEDIQIMNESIGETLEIFKNIVISTRPNIDIDKILSAKVWYGKNAMELKLVDELSSVNEYLETISKDNDVYFAEFIKDKKFNLDSIASELSDISLNIWNHMLESTGKVFGSNNYARLKL